MPAPELAHLIGRLRGLRDGMLISLDFDGTLAPIVDDPSLSAPVEGAVDALTRLAAQGASVVLITGRDASTAVELSGLSGVAGLRVEGLYGLQRWRDGVVEAPPEPRSIADTRAALPAVLEQAEREDGAVAGTWIEDKGLSLVLHFRRADDPARAEQVLAPLASAVAERNGLDLHPGKHVLELRVPGHDKGRTLRRLVDELNPSAVLYAGDDLGDVPAFDAVLALRGFGIPAWAVSVGDPPDDAVANAADVNAATPVELVAALTELAGPGDSV